MEAIVNYMKTKFLYIDPLKQGLKHNQGGLNRFPTPCFYT